jgi:integrase
VRELQELLGHSAMTTTAIYLHINPEALREKIQKTRESVQDDKRATLVAELAALQDKVSALVRQVEELEVVT